MPEIEPQFKEERKESRGEMNQRLSSYITEGLFFIGWHLTVSEQEALAKMIGSFLRWVKYKD